MDTPKTILAVQQKIKSASLRLDGEAGMIIITEPSEYNPKGVWKLSESAARAMLIQANVPHADVSLSIAVRKFSALVSLPSASKLQFDAFYGEQGQPLVDATGKVVNDTAGNPRTYKKTGYNCLNTRAVLSSVAVTDINNSLNRSSEAIDAKMAELSFNAKHGISTTGSNTTVKREVEQEETVEIG